MTLSWIFSQRSRLCAHCLPAVGIVGLKYLVYVLMYVYYQLGGVQKGVEGRGVSACMCVVCWTRTHRLEKGRDGLTKPHSHLKQAKKCHFSHGCMPAH